MKIIVRHKNNYNDKQELSLEEFKTKFSKELASALQIYCRDEQRREVIKMPYKGTESDYTADFYLDLRWNFNTNAQTVYYIDRIE